MAGLLREAFGQIRALRTQLAERSAPIAIVGAACRFPGGANDLESFARVLRAGTDAVARVPADRWDADFYYDADSDAPGKMHTREAACIERIDEFDAAFLASAPARPSTSIRSSGCSWKWRGRRSRTPRCRRIACGAAAQACSPD